MLGDSLPVHNRGHHPPRTIFDQFHHDRFAFRLLHLASAEARSHRAGGQLAAFAQRAFPEAAEVEFQTLVGTLHCLSTK